MFTLGHSTSGSPSCHGRAARQDHPWPSPSCHSRQRGPCLPWPPSVAHESLIVHGGFGQSPYTEQGSGRTGPHRTPNASHHRPTTLSILKSQHAPKGYERTRSPRLLLCIDRSHRRNNQIAALEAKLAMMEHAHPDDPRGSLSPSYLPQSRDDSPAMRDDAGPSGTSGPAADEDLSVDAFLDEATGDVDSPEAPEPEKALSLLMPAGLGLPARPSAATIAAAEMLANQPAPRPPPNRVMPSAEVPPAALEPEPASGGGAGSISSSTSMPLPPLAQPQEEARRSPALPPPRGKPKNKGPSNRQVRAACLIS